MPFVSINPATGAEIDRHEAHTPAEVEQRLQRGFDAFRANRARSFAERAAALRTVADLLEAQADTLAELMTREMGKPLAQARGEAEKCAWVCRHYALHAERYLADEPVDTDAARSFVAYEPLGPILAIMPWNYPLWQVFRHAAPALMAGNTVLLKHAPNVTGCARAVETLLREAGFDAYELQVLLVETEHVESVIADRRVRGVTLTGSDRAGRAVAAQAGQHLKPTVLELGGSDPFIVLADADLDRALDLGFGARMQNNGQSCIAAKRFILEKPIADAYVERFVARAASMVMGDPMDEATDLGPLARPDLRDTLADQVARARRETTTCLTGGDVPEDDAVGTFYPPTVLADVTPGTVPFDEELFGPVASMIVADDLDHAVELANATRYGLGGAVFTEDLERGEHVARRLEVGCAFVNAKVASDPRLPFGGVKDSGYGRELARHGIRAFVNAKTVWVAS
jgi:succinate-semialdehyde dehydrogenase/glutarate-semialdehyde dehydrogenase